MSTKCRPALSVAPPQPRPDVALPVMVKILVDQHRSTGLVRAFPGDSVIFSKVCMRFLLLLCHGEVMSPMPSKKVPRPAVARAHACPRAFERTSGAWHGELGTEGRGTRLALVVSPEAYTSEITRAWVIAPPMLGQPSSPTATTYRLLVNYPTLNACPTYYVC